MAKPIINSKSIVEIVNNANMILDGNINLLQGVRNIDRLRINTNYSDDNIFNLFILISSDLDRIPLDEDIRKRYSQQFLSQLDQEYKSYIIEIKPEILEACKLLIKRFENIK